MAKKEVNETALKLRILESEDFSKAMTILIALERLNKVGKVFVKQGEMTEDSMRPFTDEAIFAVKNLQILTNTTLSRRAANSENDYFELDTFNLWITRVRKYLEMFLEDQD